MKLQESPRLLIGDSFRLSKIFVPSVPGGYLVFRKGPGKELNVVVTMQPDVVS